MTTLLCWHYVADKVCCWVSCPISVCRELQHIHFDCQQNDKIFGWDINYVNFSREQNDKIGMQSSLLKDCVKILSQQDHSVIKCMHLLRFEFFVEIGSNSSVHKIFIVEIDPFILMPIYKACQQWPLTLTALLRLKSCIHLSKYKDCHVSLLALLRLKSCMKCPFVEIQGLSSLVVGIVEIEVLHLLVQIQSFLSQHCQDWVLVSFCWDTKLAVTGGQSVRVSSQHCQD